MKERPILFSGEMVRAILEGRKTQTRRVIKPRKPWLTQSKWYGVHPGGGWHGVGFSWITEEIPEEAKQPCGKEGFPCPYGQPGDRLWVRETWKLSSYMEGEPLEYQFKADGATFEEDTNLSENYPWYEDWWERICGEADKYLNKINHPIEEDGNFHWHQGQSPLPWKPSIFMPRWASRITLEIVKVRVERVQEISDEDISAEGMEAIGPFVSIHSQIKRSNFIDRWNSINAKRGFSWGSNPWVWVIEFKKVEAQVCQ
jgi:hypothetical protein